MSKRKIKLLHQLQEKCPFVTSSGLTRNSWHLYIAPLKVLEKPVLKKKGTRKVYFPNKTKELYNWRIWLLNHLTQKLRAQWRHLSAPIKTILFFQQPKLKVYKEFTYYFKYWGSNWNFVLKLPCCVKVWKLVSYIRKMYNWKHRKPLIISKSS